MTDGDRWVWFVDADYQTRQEITLATAYYGTDGEGRHEAEANARLIAAAPDLLAALGEFRNAWREALSDDSGMLQESLERLETAAQAARLAIAKATTPQP